MKRIKYEINREMKTQAPTHTQTANTPSTPLISQTFRENGRLKLRLRFLLNSMLEFKLTTPMICNFFFAISRIAGGKLCCLEKKLFRFFSISVEIFYRMTTNDLLNRSNNHSPTIFFFRRKIEMCCHFLYFDF